MLPIPLRVMDGGDTVPWATIGLIVVNVLVFGVSLGADPEETAQWMLVFGELDPLQWVTSLFLHGGWLHLAFNMLFLWIFGIVVEGVAGAPRFLALYISAGALESMVTQFLMLDALPIEGGEGGPRGALGASGAVFGTVAAALLWAPRTRIEGVLFLGLRAIPFGASVLLFAVLYLLAELARWALADFETSSELMHLLGAAVGWSLAWVMLRLGWVDTGGWDLFSAKSRRKAW